MANGWKIDFIFNGGRQGWSETWYKFGDGLTYDTVFIRVSSMSVVGDSLPRSKPPTFVDPQTSANPRGIVEKAWLFRATAGSGGGLYRRQVWLRGMPDAWSDWDAQTGRAKVPDLLNDKIKAFRDALILKNFSLRVLDKTVAPKTIKNVTIQNGAYVITTDLAHGLGTSYTDVDGVPRRTRIRISGANFAGNDLEVANGKHINGVTELSAVTNDTLTAVKAPLDEATPIQYVGGGRLVSQVYVYVPVVDLVRIKLAKKDTGRAFFVPRGRSPKRRRTVR
jgi:hypothetical protein